MNYNSLDQHLHQLCQILAKANRSFVPQKEDDSHTNLYFDHLSGMIKGRWIETDSGLILLGLDLNSRDIKIMNRSIKVTRRFPIIDLKYAELELEISRELASFNLSGKEFRKSLHFEISDYDLKKKSIPAFSNPAINEWMSVRSVANQVCYDISGYLGIFKQPRIWPHHFDTGIHYTVTSALGIGIGLAMQDSMASEPYFYIAGYPSSGQLNYHDLPKLDFGAWKITEHWRGAILPISNLSSNEEDYNIALTNRFMADCLKWYLGKI